MSPQTIKRGKIKRIRKVVENIETPQRIKNNRNMGIKKSVMIAMIGRV